ncbi:kinase-like protein [Zopfia rhizophila CBS 207.26]|uniref:Kinase-like protein n=1 Tax=Zopfia rhizophila CBS 207.26 TaxID=1314779 RepID=A0A6A6ED90_9PEZI|nr:kinase-like protein [Zopfia rhizophila CBS 207.26]
MPRTPLEMMQRIDDARRRGGLAGFLGTIGAVLDAGLEGIRAEAFDASRDLFHGGRFDDLDLEREHIRGEQGIEELARFDNERIDRELRERRERGEDLPDVELEPYFSPYKTKYTDEDFERIASLLRTKSSRYNSTPRLYTLLRRLDCLSDLDRFLQKGLSDHSLPFSQTQLPSEFSEGWKKRFLEIQHLVCDDSTVVQMISLGKHMTFAQMPKYFDSERVIGTGGRGQVDQVFCTLGGAQSYARKQFSRNIMSVDDASTAAIFINEVENMKQIVHRHCVKLVASYTDPYVFAFIMLPVAESNLADYFKDAVESSNKRTFLPQFLGCLSRALWHIHYQQLRHRDIKPENILVSQNRVLFTDFDSSYSWAHTMHSTTIRVPPRTWKYASPEVARSGRETPQIKSSSDIWSLGCVFLEIITVWKGRTVKELEDYLKRSDYYDNPEGIRQWIEELQRIDTQHSVTVALEWIQGMLQVDPKERPTAHKLVEMTSDFCCVECKGDDSRRIERRTSPGAGEDGDSDSSAKPSGRESVSQGNPHKSVMGSSTSNEPPMSPTIPGWTSPPDAQFQPVSESTCLADVCREMGKDPGSLTEEQRALISATYRYLYQRLGAGFTEAA